MSTTTAAAAAPPERVQTLILDVPNASPADEILDDDDATSTSGFARDRELARARETRDCFKTPEGRYNLGKTWTTKSASFVMSRGSGYGSTRVAGYDSRNRRRIETGRTRSGWKHVTFNAGDGAHVLEYNASTECKPIGKIGFNGVAVTALSVRDGRTDRYDFLVGLANGEVVAMDLEKNVAEKTKKAVACSRWNADGAGVCKSRVTALRWVPRESQAMGFDCISAHADGSLYIYDSASDGPSAKIEPLLDRSALSVANAGDPSSNPRARWHFGESSLNAAEFSPDGDHLAVVNGAGMCRVLFVGAAKPTVISGFKSYYGGFNAVAWTPCGRYIIAGGESDMVEIWGFYEREVLAWGCGGHRSWITDIFVDERLMRDRSNFLRFASVGEDCRVALWDLILPDDEEEAPAIEEQAARLSISSTRHGRRASFAGPDAQVACSARRDEVQRIVPIMTHKLHTQPVTAVRFTDEGVLTATADSIKLWLRPTTSSRYAHCPQP